jgi:ribosomal protein L11 methyltransferase
MSDWLEIAVPAADDSADDIAALLVAELADAQAGVELRAGEIVFWVPLSGSEAALATTRSAASRLAAAGLPVDAAGVVLRPAVPESEWREAWKRYFKVSRLTRQIVVVPSWERHEPAGDDLIIDLDPGQAFGTGLHASTRLVLEELQRLADEGVRPARVLDLGTGSGILAIAAARFWPDAAITAVDNDPLAVKTAAENCAHNRLAERITATTSELAALDGTFDVVLANIQANVLEELAGELCAKLGPGGSLVLSGLLSPQAAPLGDHFARVADLEVVSVQASAADPAWSSVRLARPGR